MNNSTGEKLPSKDDILLTGGNSPVSDSAISKALALLLEDFRDGNQDPPIAEDTNRDTHTAFGLLNRNAHALELILSSFDRYVRCEIANIRRQQNMLAAIHRLPSELLQHIFLLAVPEHLYSGVDTAVIHKEYTRPIYSEPLSKRDLPTVPPETGYSVAINIAAVSSHWYRVAQAMPQLWSSLDTSHSLGVTKILLERSKQTPLHIRCSDNVNDEHESRFMKLALSHLHRWRSFESFTGFGDLSRFLDENGGSAPLLERWILRGYIRWVFREDVPGFVLTESPNLRDFHIASMGEYPFRAQVLSGLTNLSISAVIEDDQEGYQEFTTEQFELLLSSSPKLETLFIHGRGEMNTNQISLFSGKLPNLKSIYLRHLSSTTSITLLLSIFPRPSDFQVAKVLGKWDEEWFLNTSFDHTRHGCVLDLTVRPMTWLSVARNEEEDDEDEDDACDLCIRVGKEIQGTRVMSLEILTLPGLAQGAIVSLFHLDVPTSLRSIELESDTDIQLTSTQLLGRNLHLVPRLQSITITFNRQLLPFSLHTLVESLIPPSRWGLEVDQLIVKGVDKLQPVIHLFTTLVQESSTKLLSDVAWGQLRKLEVQYTRDSLADDDIDGKAELLALTKALNVDVALVPASN